MSSERVGSFGAFRDAIQQMTCMGVRTHCNALWPYRFQWLSFVEEDVGANYGRGCA